MANIEIKQLKQLLSTAESVNEELLRDYSTQMMQTAELSKMMETHNEDDLRLQLQVKSLQCAELTVQVQHLRKVVDECNTKVRNVEGDLKLSVETVGKLAEERKVHQMMIVELGDVVRTLGQIPVDYQRTDNNNNKNNNNSDWTSSSPASESLANVKRKVMAIEEDRQHRIQEIELLSAEIVARDERIETLNRQFVRIQAVDRERKLLLKENGQLRFTLKRTNQELEEVSDEKDRLKSEVETKDSKIEALEHLFSEINTDRTEEGGPVYVAEDDSPGALFDLEIMSQNDGSTEVILTTKHLSEISADGNDPAAAGGVGDNDDEDDDGWASVSTTSSRSSASSSSSVSSAASSLVSPQAMADKEQTQQTQQIQQVQQQQQQQQKVIDSSMIELGRLKKRYTALKNDHDSALGLMKTMERQLDESKKRTRLARKKQEVREGLLREVIFQYKRLQKEHDEVNARMRSTVRVVPNSQHDIDKDDPVQQGKDDGDVGKQKRNKKTKVGGGTVPAKKRKGGRSNKNVEQPSTLEETPTSDLSDDSPSVVSALSTPSTSSTVTTPSRRQGSIGGVGEGGQEGGLIGNGDNTSTVVGVEEEVQYQDSRMVEELERLRKECDRMEHEYDDAITRISNLEDELKTAKELAVVAQKLARVREDDLSVAAQKTSDLRRELENAVEARQEVEDELRFAQLQADEARRKQKERELDLLDVIAQYKELAEENDENINKIKGVSKELSLAKRERHDARRRDLVVEYRRLEREYDDATATIQKLERDLKLSKSQAARNKEEANQTRSRLAGAHFHFKKLRNEFDVEVGQREELEKELKDVKKEVEMYQAQEECLTEEIVSSREERKVTEDVNRSLVAENEKLKGFCEDLMGVESPPILEVAALD